jgi:hypothetical protein
MENVQNVPENTLEIKAPEVQNQSTVLHVL